MNVTDKEWLSAYVYCSPYGDELLLTEVSPFVEAVLSEGLAEKFFFVRYWERGPHLRLRFQGDEDVLERRVKPELESICRDFFKKRPSPEPPPEPTSGTQEWYPTGTIRYVDYEPEVERYGGPTGILIAERQFHASTRTVFSAFKAYPDWNYDRALGAAIHLHLALAYASGMTFSETAEFFSYVFRCWFSSAYLFGLNSPPEDLKQYQDETLSAFENSFVEQEDDLIPFHQTLWQAFEEQEDFEQDWLNDWMGEMSEIGSELIAAQHRNELIFSQPPPDSAVVAQERRLLWPILESYVHMTNNRLGVMNQDESYLGYLIVRSLQKLSQHTI